jgi:hypothetical protein
LKYATYLAVCTCIGSLTLSLDIELAFSVLFADPLALALGENNVNMLLKIKFQQGNFVAKSEFN